MKILLIKPPEKEVYTKVPTVAGLAQPMGLASIAAYVREKGYSNIKILDCEAERVGLDKINEHIPKNIDVVGLGSVTPTLKNATEVMKIAKKINPNCTTILGGDHISALPKETMQEFPSIDMGVVGEGEITFHEILNAIEQKNPLDKIKGLVYRKGNKINLNAPRPLIPDINVLFTHTCI